MSSICVDWESNMRWWKLTILLSIQFQNIERFGKIWQRIVGRIYKSCLLTHFINKIDLSGNGNRSWPLSSLIRQLLQMIFHMLISSPFLLNSTQKSLQWCISSLLSLHVFEGVNIGETWEYQSLHCHLPIKSSNDKE